MMLKNKEDKPAICLAVTYFIIFTIPGICQYL